MKNELNFSGGPGALPATVLAAVQQAIACVPEVGLSVLGISHRSEWFAAVVAEAEANIRALLGLSDDYAVLFLQGGASLQFSMIPLSFLRDTGKTAEYLHTGYWSGKAIPEARREGDVRVIWDGAADGFHRLPAAGNLVCCPEAAYLHYVSNETVEGTQFHYVPGRDGVLRICDMSSDLLSRPVDTACYDLIYAHAQKNLGPAGVTVVILRKALLQRLPRDLPSMLDYREHLAARSISNTPPVFAIYVVLLVTRWLRDDIGGLAAMDRINRQKAKALYRTIDSHADFYTGWAAPQCRSLMNVTFRLPNVELELAFLREAAAAQFSGLAGHRSLGGIRASIYNAMTLRAVETLCEFMADFARRAG